MKTLFHTLMLLAAALPALGASLPTAMMDTNGGLASPSKATFIRQNVLNQSGITRQVDFVTDLNAATSPYRSGEHVLVIDAGAFGAGGPVLFFHDSGSSDPTNTTDTFICTAGGRWKVKRLFGSIPSFADVTSKPTNILGYGITDALPLSAGSNAPLTGTLYVPSIKLGSDIERTNWPTGGGALSNTIDALTVTNLTVVDTFSADTIDVASLTVDTFNATNASFSGTMTVPKPSSGASNSAPPTTSWVKDELAAINSFSAQVTIITNAGTGMYSVPSGASLLKVWGWAPGGGGGSGRKGLTNTIVCGGGGGGAGAGGYIEIPVLALDGATTIAWTNGAAGIGGASQTTNSSNGLPGTAGGMTSFGLWLVLSGGGGGAGGTASSGTAGTAGDDYGVWIGRSGGSANASGTGGSAGGDAYDASPYFLNQRMAAGGGGGGGITAAGIASTGGRGGIAGSYLLLARGGNGYGANGAINSNGGNAVSLNAALPAPGCGAGGGGSSVTGNGGNGGLAGLYGAGGGGGGAAGDGIGDSGAGGDGAPGIIMIVAE